MGIERRDERKTSENKNGFETETDNMKKREGTGKDRRMYM